ncbi:MAG TPA: sigma 54-interacting transcriptional regulator [Polyangiaceae bacterium LLY-WYZ-14_1]|nr:sigma 54-interacting transcriptional regulator [Polyangiaceae bacterium LLY-WYZ-14_1]
MSVRPTWTTTSIEVLPSTDPGSDPTPGLVLVYAPTQERLPPVFAFQEGENLLGRDPEHRIHLPDAAVSRTHARVERQGEHCWIEDCRSTNGTLINGRRTQRTRLRDHDIVRVGDNVFRFVARSVYDFAAFRVDEVELPPRRAEAAARGLAGGRSLSRVLEQIDKVAPTDLSVVIQGESGTGKELVARELHVRSGRKGAFVPVNCGAIVAQLGESELFGHKKGAFTGATSDQPGLIRAAQGGTLFLDEIGEMSLELQVKLLRVLQERQVVPVGGTAGIPVDFRVVAATHRDLERLVGQGSFRGDLLARLRDFVIELPALRQRREDLVPLVRHVLRQEGREDLPLSVPFMVALAHYEWPYNVRELERAVRHALALLEPGEPLELKHLPETVRRPLAKHGRWATEEHPVGEARPTPLAVPSSAPPPALVPDAEGVHPPRSGIPGGGRGGPSTAPEEGALRACLARHRGNVAAVAREYGKQRMQVHRWMARYGIDPNHYRS